VLEVLEVFGSPPPPKDPPTVFDIGQKKKDADMDGGGAKPKEDEVIKNSGEVIDEPPAEAQNGKQESFKVRKAKLFANVGLAKPNR